MNDEILKAKILIANTKFLRENCGMSQQELSKKLGYGDDSNPVKDWESDKSDRVIPPNIYTKIANVFEISVSTLTSENLENYASMYAQSTEEDLLKKLFPYSVSEIALKNYKFKKAFNTHMKLFDFELLEDIYKCVLEAYKEYEEAYKNGIKDALINMISISCLYKYLSKHINLNTKIEDKDIDVLSKMENYSEFLKNNSNNKKRFLKKITVINLEETKKEINEFISSTTNIMLEMIYLLKKELEYNELADYYLAIMYANNLINTGYSKSENNLFGTMYLETLYKLNNPYAIELAKTNEEASN